MTLGQMREALRQRRLEHNLSFDQLAAEIGLDRVTSYTLRRFVKGDVEPREMTVYAIRTYLERVQVAA